MGDTSAGFSEVDDPQERTIERYLRGLESEELTLAARQLRELQGSPGWAMLSRLCNIEIARQRRRMELKPLDSVGDYAHINGAIRGLRLPSQIIRDVLELSAEVQAALEREGGNA